MDKSFQYSFCKVCKNRKYGIKQGIYCDITGLKPQFETSCSLYNLDKKEKQRLTEIKRIQFKKKKNKYDAIEHFLSFNIEHKKTNIFDIKKNGDFSKTYKLKTFVSLNKIVSTVVVIAIIMAIVVPAIQSLDGGKILNSLFIIIILIFLFRQGIKYLFDSNLNLLLSIDCNGIRIRKNEIIPWQDILFTLIEIDFGKRNVPKYLIISRISTSEDITLEITHLEVSYEELGGIIEIFKENYKRNTLPNNL